MSDNQSGYSGYNNDDWELSPTQSQYATWTDDEDGADGVFQVVDVDGPKESPFKAEDKDGNPIWAKNPDGSIVYDEYGEPVQKINYQLEITSEVLSLEVEKPDQFIGQKVKTFYGYTLNNDSNLSKLAKVFVGKDVESPDFRLRKSHLMGGVYKGTIEVGPPKGEKKIRYPKVTNPRPARLVPAATSKKSSKKSDDITTEGPPF